MIKYINCNKKNYLKKIKKIISYRPITNNKAAKSVKKIIINVKKKWR